MKAKFIYEKFTEDSDPIHDMHIGYFYSKELNFKKVNEFFDFLLILLPFLLKVKKIPNDILRNGGYINRIYYNMIEKHINKYNVRFKDIIVTSQECRIYYWPKQLRHKLLHMGFKCDENMDDDPKI